MLALAAEVAIQGPGDIGLPPARRNLFSPTIDQLLSDNGEKAAHGLINRRFAQIVNGFR